MKKQQHSAIEALWEELPTQQRVISKTPNGVIYGTYLTSAQVLRKLQEVFGLRYRITFSHPTQVDGKLWVVHCRVSVFSDDGFETVVEGIGTSAVNGGQVETAIKGAETDALKRALRWLGIGMFQYETPSKFAPQNGNSHSNNGKSNSGSPSPDKVAIVEQRLKEWDETLYEAILSDDIFDVIDAYIDEFSDLPDDEKPTPKQVFYALANGVDFSEAMATPRKDYSPLLKRN